MYIVGKYMSYVCKTLETGRKISIWWFSLDCFVVNANKLYIIWQGMYIVSILQCQIVQDNFKFCEKVQ